MKYLILTSAIAFAFGSIASADAITYKEVAVSLTDVYVPSGFDSSADAYVVVNGLFPNSCYSLAEPQIDNVSATEHNVRTIAKVKSGICLRVFVPFNKEISLGKLTSGKHTLRFYADDGTYFEKSMSIE